LTLPIVFNYPIGGLDVGISLARFILGLWVMGSGGIHFPEMLLNDGLRA